MSTAPNFFLVGAPKAGTTSLYHYLAQHPDVYLSPIKEPCYFASEVRPENFSEEYRTQVARDQEDLQAYLAGPMKEKRHGGIVEEWDQYLRLFARAYNATVVGEASVCYLWSETAAANIRRRIPGARILMVLRHPAERAFSQWSHAVGAGWTRRPFREHIEANLRNREQRFSMEFPFLEMGLYSRQVERYLAAFPREQVMIAFYKEPDLFNSILRFLHLDPDFKPNASQRHLEMQVPRSLHFSQYLKSKGIWQHARRLCPAGLLPLARRLVQVPRRTLRMDPRDRAFLCGYYREDVQRLAQILNRDLSAWLS